MAKAARFGPTCGLALGLVATLGCASAHWIESEHALNPGGRLHLQQAREGRPEARDGQLLVRYLRAGGVYFEWFGQALMTAPFASNYPLFAKHLTRYEGLVRARQRGAQFEFRWLFNQRIQPDERAIGFVLGGGMRLGQVGALLAGHSHYDHLGDVSVVMRRYLEQATLYASASAKNMLAGEPDLANRIRVLSERDGWSSAQPLIRFLPIRSGHAPNLRLWCETYSWAPGKVQKAWSTPLAGHELWDLKVGETYAFVIDFLDPTNHRVVFRVHYQDAASAPPLGYTPESVLAERDVDLEVVTMPGREAMPSGPDAYPVGVLQHDRARHALVIHYESFFHPVLQADRASDPPVPNDVRLIDTLRGSPSEEFLDAVASGVTAGAECSVPAVREGMRARQFSVPLPGEWLLFDTQLSDASCR